MAHHARGRREGVRRRVLYAVTTGSFRGRPYMRLTLECGHVMFRRQDGARPIWAVCETCAITQRLGED